MELRGSQIKRVMQEEDRNKDEHNERGWELADTGDAIYMTGEMYDDPHDKRMGLVLKARGRILENPNRLKRDLRKRDFIDNEYLADLVYDRKKSKIFK